MGEYSSLYEKIRKKNLGESTPASSKSSSGSSGGTYSSAYEKIKNAHVMRADVDPTITVDDSYISKFFDDYNRFVSSASESYKGIGYGNAGKLYDDYGQQGEDLRKRGDAIKRYLWANRDAFGDEYDSIADSIEQMMAGQRSIVDSYRATANNMNLFDSEDAYNQYVQRQQNYQDKWGHYVDAPDYEDYSARGASIKNPTMSEAERGITIFGKQIGGADVGNIVTYSRDNHERIGMGEANGSTVVGKSLYHYMTDDEVGIYNYLLAKEGGESAQAYLDDLEEDLNFRMGTAQAGTILSMDNPVVRAAAIAATSVGSGVDQWGSGIRQLLSNEKLPTSSAQFGSSKIAESLDGVGRYAYLAGNTIGNMAPSILLSSLTAGLGASSAVAQGVGNFALGASAAGNAYGQALADGYSTEQARTYGVFVGASEALLQHLLGGIGSLGGVTSGKIMSKVAAIDNSLLRIAAKMGASIGSEIVEEELQTFLEPAFRSILFGEDYDAPTIDELIETALVTAMSTGLLEGPGNIGGDIANSRYYSKNYGDVAQELVAEGLESPDGSVSKTLAQKYQEILNGNGSLNGHQLGRMVEANEQQFTADDMAAMESAAAQRLTELGETGDVSAIGKALAKQAAGEKLTRTEKSAIQTSKYGQRVANEMNPSNIESGEYSTDWAQQIGTNRVNAESYNAGLQALAEEMAGVKPTDSAPAEAGQETTTSVGDSTPKPVMPVTERFTASGEGKTSIADMGKVQIASTENGKMTLKTESGQTVKAEDVSFRSEDEAMVYSAVLDMGVSPVVAQSIVDNFDGTDGRLYAEDVKLAYQYGKMNFPKSYLEKLDIKPHQAEHAYNLGRSDAKAEVFAPKTKRTVNGKRGTVTFETAVDESTLKPIQRESLNGIKAIADLSGLNVHVFMSDRDNGFRYTMPDGAVTTANGWYIPGTNEIWIDLNAGKTGEGTMLYTFAHEISHYIKEWSPTKWRVMADFLLEQYGEDVPLDALLQRQMDKISKRDPSLKGNALMDAAYEELVSDAMSEMLVDGEVAQKLAELKQKDRTLWEKIKEAIHNLLERWGLIRKEYEGKTPDAGEAQFLRGMDEAFKKLQQLYTEAFAEASENFAAAAEEVLQSRAKPVSDSEIVTDGAVVVDGNGNKFSIRSMKADIAEGKMFDDLMKYCGWSQARVNELRRQLTDLVAYMEPHRDILDMNESYGREGRKFSPYKPNSDPLYQISMDFSTLCSKRLLTQYVIENLQLRENRPMSAEEQMAIRDMLIEYRQVEKGLQVACAMCYVEAARLKSPKQMQRWLNDPAPLLRDYFGKANKAFNDSVKEAQADFKESRGYARNAPKKDMKAADVRELNKIGPKMRAEYQLSEEEQKIVDRAKALPNSTYLTAGNLAKLSETDPVIYHAYTSFVRTATRSKSLETDEPYYYGDSTRDNGNGIIVSDSFIEAVNRESGMRFSSWSDWRIQHLLDYITAVIDNSVRGAAMHGYTKFAEEVRVLGKTGMMFNLSGVTGTQTGLNPDGSLNFSPTESIDINDAIELREEFPETAGLQCIGVSDDHIFALLRSDVIDYVIPYHVSGLNKGLRRMADIHGWKDYTDTQHAAIDKSVKNTGQEHWHEEPVYSEFFVGYDTGMTGEEAMQESARRYVQMCRERGLTPKFEKFVNEPGYWKLLVDRKMINQKTGELIQQKPVTPTFDFDAIKAVVDRHVENYDSGLEARALNYVVKNWDSVPGRIRDLKKGGTKKTKSQQALDTLYNEMMAAQPTEGGEMKLSDRDAEAVEFSDINTKFSVRDEAPPKKTIYAYKAFYAHDGKLYPPMVANLSEEEQAKIKGAVSGTLKALETPVGVWVNADVGGIATHSADVTEYDIALDKAKAEVRKRLKKQGYDMKSKATQALVAEEAAKLAEGASATTIVHKKGEVIRNTTGRLAVQNAKSGGDATLAFRPGWHLGEWPDAKQFNKDSALGARSVMPDSLVFCLCEIAADVDYQLDAMSYGVNAKGKFDRTQAGLPRVPVDGYYKYRTNVDPTTAPWYITGAMRVVEVLDDADCARICAEYGVTPDPRESGKPIDLAAYGLKRGPVAPTKDLGRFKKNQKNLDNEAMLERALSDPAYASAYVQRDIDFDDPEIVKEFERNRQSADEYRKKAGGIKLSDRDITQDPLFPATGREAGVFKRSYMNQAGALKPGEAKGIIINTDAFRYYVEAVGSSGHNPFTGEILEKVNADTGERISATQEEYDNGTYDAGEEDYLAYQAAQRKPGRGSNRHRSLKERLAADGYAHLLDDESDGDSEGDRALGGGSAQSGGVKLSDRDTDGNQLSKGQQAFFKDSVVRDADGNLMAMYHGTANGGSFTVFDGDKLGNETRTTQLGQGFYFTNVKEEAEAYTKNVDIYGRVSQGSNPHLHKVYLNITNPFNVKMDTLDINAVKAVYMDGTYAYFFDQWIPFYMNKKTLNGRTFTKADVQAMSKEERVSVYVDYLSQLGTKEVLSNMVRAFPYGKQGGLLASMQNRLGYDGLVEEFKPGQFQYVAFAPEQVKATDNFSPTADRDIRYSDRDTDSVSHRDLLAGAFESIAQNDIERGKIAEYQQKVKQLNEQERKLAEIRKELGELSFAKGPRDNDKIRKLREEATKISNRIGIYDKQLLRLEASAPLMAVLEREKKLAYSRASQKWADRMETARTGRNKTEMRHKIKGIVSELNQLLLHGSKDKHVMIGLQKATAEALSAINMDTVAAEERLAKIQAKIDRATDPAELAKLQQTYARIEEMGMNMNARLAALKNAYEDIKDSGDPLIAGAYQPEIEERIKNLRKMVGETPLRNMSMEQLEFTYDTYKMVLTTIRNANKAFKNERGETIAVLGNKTMQEIETVGGKHPLAMKAMKGPLSFAWSGLKPTYAFKAIGSDTLSEMFENVRAGEDTWAVDVSEAKEFYRQKTQQYHFDSWDMEKQYSFTSKTGKEFKLTLEQIMSLYAYSKRKQADAHLDKGGFVFDDAIEVVQKKHGIPVKYTVKTADAHNLSRDTLMAICKTLTDEQVKFVDEMQEYLSTVIGEKGNEVSLEMYGVKLFKEKFYFPLKSAKQYMFEQNEVAGEVKIKNSGFSKETVQHASNPVILSNFTDVWASHVNDMAMYHAFVLPLEDFNRVFNYKTPNDANLDTESVKMFLQNAYGRQPEQYIRQLLTDLNGGARSDPNAGIINKLIGIFKKSAVFASMSVVVQQPSAIARAAAYIDTKYFVGKPSAKAWEEVKKYAPVAIIKEMGYFDTNMGVSTTEFIKAKEYHGAKAKMAALVTDSQYRDEILSKAPAVADELAWCQIWEAVKKETAAKGLKGEELLQAAGKRFTEVIVNTQVYDSVLSRSGMMRSKDTGVKMATSFMAEPTTSLNMITDALIQGKRGNKSYARKAIGSVIASMILNSILVSFVYAGRDDDEDKTYAEKYVGTLTGELIDSFNPLTMIPFVKDIVSIAQGYDVERSDMAVVTDLYKAWKNLSNENRSTYRKVEDFGGAVAAIFGLPVKNIMRDLRGMYNTVMSFVDGNKTTGRGVGEAARENLPKLVGGGERSNSDELYHAMLRDDAKHTERVKARFKDERAVAYAIRDGLVANDKRITAAAEARVAGNQSEYLKLAREITGEGHFSQDDVVRAINYVTDKLRKGETESTSSLSAPDTFKVEDYYNEVVSNDQAEAEVVKREIISGMVADGKTAEEAEKSFNNSFKNSAVKPAFIEGDIAMDRAIAMLQKYGGLTEDAAAADVEYWTFSQNYPNIPVEDSWFDAYYKYAADVNIPVDTYMTYRNDVRGITGDGKKARRMAVIDSLPLTSAQKDALYYSEGWAASTIWEAPWH